MKLLPDENLSDRITSQIRDLYPDTAHVQAHNLTRSDDAVIWAFAQRHSFTIVSKDSDFHQRSLLYGAPPKFIYLRVGNCATVHVVEHLRSNFSLIEAFHSESSAAILILS